MSWKRNAFLVLICALLMSGLSFGNSVQAKTTKNPQQYKVVTPGILMRSGLPSDKQFIRLKKKGVVSIVSLLPANEPGGKGDVTKLPSFNKLGFRFLPLPIAGSYPPTQTQAKQFLTFVKNPRNQPVLVFCKAGNARTGTMVALYRYAVEGWTMEKAIRESKRFGGGPSTKQIAWLRSWAATHAPGSHQ